MPFVVTMGNHDAEHMAKDNIYDFLKNLHPGLEKGPGDVMGVVIVRYRFLIHDKEKIESVLYCIDSNDYQWNKLYGFTIGFISTKIAWYRKQSAHFAFVIMTSLPSLAFSHSFIRI